MECITNNSLSIPMIKKLYSAPAAEFDALLAQALICESGSTEDYDVIDDFEW